MPEIEKDMGGLQHSKQEGGGANPQETNTNEDEEYQQATRALEALPENARNELYSILAHYAAETNDDGLADTANAFLEIIEDIRKKSRKN